MNPGKDMISITTQSDNDSSYETIIYINKRDVFKIDTKVADKYGCYITIVRWEIKNSFYIKETPEELLKLMGREEK